MFFVELFFRIVNCEGFMGICVKNLDIYCGFRKRAVFTVVSQNETLFRCIKPELLEIYEGNPNTRGKMGGHKIVTSTSTYVHMGRFPWYLSGEIVYPKVNVHRDVSFQRPFFTKQQKSSVNLEGFG